MTSPQRVLLDPISAASLAEHGRASPDRYTYGMNAKRSGRATNVATTALDNAPRQAGGGGYIEQRIVIETSRIGS